MWPRRRAGFVATIALQRFLGGLVDGGATATDIRRALTTVAVQNDEDLAAAA